MRRACCAGRVMLAIALLLPAAVAVAQAPSLTAGDESSIRQYVHYWADQIRNAPTQDAVAKARQMLIQGYQRDTSAAHQYTYAKQATEALTPLLALPSAGKQINTAMAIIEMPQTPIQDALEALVHHDNPAVRYLGWQGYTRARGALLTEGGTFANRYNESLQNAARQEDSGIVLMVILQAANLSPERPTSIGSDVYARCQQVAFDALQDAWPRICRQVIAGSDVYADTARTGIAALQSLATAYAQDPKRVQQILQMVVDAAYCGAKTYERQMRLVLQTEEKLAELRAQLEAASTPTPAPGPVVPVPPGPATGETTAAPAEDSAVIRENIRKQEKILHDANAEAATVAMLLLECERVLNGITTQQKDYLNEPLRNDRVNALRKEGIEPTIWYRKDEKDYGVLAWVKALESYGVVKPKFEPPATAPTSGPGTTP